MRKDGVIELGRRAISLALFVIAVVQTFTDLRAPSWTSGLLWGGLGVATYVLIPRPSIPDKALRHEAIPATVMPDVLGFLFGITFFALPLVIINSEAWLEGVWQIPAMFAIPGLFALVVLYMAARYACSWVQLRKDGLLIANLWTIVDLPFKEITKVNAIERRLPRWVGWALVAFGGLRGAGVALLHANRAAHYLDFERETGPPVKFNVDALPDIKRLVSVLKRAGVPLDAELA